MVQTIAYLSSTLHQALSKTNYLCCLILLIFLMLICNRCDCHLLANDRIKSKVAFGFYLLLITLKTQPIPLETFPTDARVMFHITAVEFNTQLFCQYLQYNVIVFVNKACFETATASSSSRRSRFDAEGVRIESLLGLL